MISSRLSSIATRSTFSRILFAVSRRATLRYASTENQQDTKQLHPIHQKYLRQVLAENEERVADRMTKHRKNLNAFIVIVSLICCIYAYTIIAVKQETFLDDFDPPEK